MQILDQKKHKNVSPHDYWLHPPHKEPAHVCQKSSPPKPTILWDAFWSFAAERQAIFFAKLRGDEWPFTRDPVLQTYRFTNAYRASDRVSQYLIKNVIYTGDQSPKELFFRIILFKTFNRTDTWELLEGECGNITYESYRFEVYDSILSKAILSGQKIYSAAYIMPSGKDEFGYPRKHQNHLRLIQLMIKEEVPQKITESKSMNQVFNLLRSYPTIGDFLAYQYAIDMNYSTLTDFSEMDFVAAGPGCKDGIAKCFSHLGGLSEEDTIRWVTDIQEEEFTRLGIRFPTLCGRSLQLIDCQNLFCEIDKYARVAYPAFSGRSGRTRIKRIYRPNPNRIVYWYPPKWGLDLGCPRGE